jgi:hypothetical protein
VISSTSSYSPTLPSYVSNNSNTAPTLSDNSNAAPAPAAAIPPTQLSSVAASELPGQAPVATSNPSGAAPALQNQSQTASAAVNGTGDVPTPSVSEALATPGSSDGASVAGPVGEALGGLKLPNLLKVGAGLASKVATPASALIDTTNGLQDVDHAADAYNQATSPEGQAQACRTAGTAIFGTAGSIAGGIGGGLAGSTVAGPFGGAVAGYTGSKVGSAYAAPYGNSPIGQSIGCGAIQADNHLRATQQEAYRQAENGQFLDLSQMGP